MVVCAIGSWRNHGINNVDDYLKTSYDPDVEFVDGVLLERNLGDWLHALIQSNVLFALRNKYPQLKVVAALRSRVAVTRYRLPDVCALLSAPKTRYLLDPISLIDPRLQLLFAYRPPALVEVEGEVISTADGSVDLSRSEIFAE